MGQKVKTACEKELGVIGSEIEAVAMIVLSRVRIIQQGSE